MSLVIGCDTGNLSLDDIFRLVSGIDVDGNTYIRLCDDETDYYDLSNLDCDDFGITALDILRGALFLNDEDEYCLNVSTALNPSIPFLLTSTGTGLGVSTLTVTVNKDTTFTLGGTARFYSDAGGTLNESTTWIATTGAARTRYIRCPSGTANFIISDNTITSWGVWTSGANAASLSGDIGRLTALTYLNITGSNTLLGDVSGLTSLTFLKVTGNNILSGSIVSLTSLTQLNLDGSNTISGSVAGLTLLTYLSVFGSNTLSGSIAALTSLTNLRVHGFNTISGSIAALTSLTFITVVGFNTISGSIAGLTSLTYIYLLGSNTVSGDLNVVSNGLTVCWLNPCGITTYTAGGDWSSINAGGIVIVNPAVGYGLSSAEVDLLIIEVEATRVPARAINITLTGSNAARTAASDVAVAAIIADGGTVTTNP